MAFHNDVSDMLNKKISTTTVHKYAHMHIYYRFTVKGVIFCNQKVKKKSQLNTEQNLQPIPNLNDSTL